LLEHALQSSARPTTLRSHLGREFVACVLVSNLQRVRNIAGSRDSRPAHPARPLPTLDDLDLGDKALTYAIRRARRILGRDIPLLVQGETGTGKEVFAQAFHQSGPAAMAPSWPSTAPPSRPT
jgi:transcriptional regulator with PAS, ATPase and Fis domain